MINKKYFAHEILLWQRRNDNVLLNVWNSWLSDEFETL